MNKVKTPLGPIKKVYLLTIVGEMLLKIKVNKNFHDQIKFTENFLSELASIYIHSFPEELREEKISNVNLQVGKAENLFLIPDNSYKIVFSWAVLIYIKPDSIKSVLENIIRISKKAVILLEMHGVNLKKYNDKNETSRIKREERKKQKRDDIQDKPYYDGDDW